MWRFLDKVSPLSLGVGRRPASRVWCEVYLRTKSVHFMASQGSLICCVGVSPRCLPGGTVVIVVSLFSNVVKRPARASAMWWRPRRRGGEDVGWGWVVVVRPVKFVSSRALKFCYEQWSSCGAWVP